jgi:hypothetical protein
VDPERADEIVMDDLSVSETEADSSELAEVSSRVSLFCPMSLVGSFVGGSVPHMVSWY